MRSIILYLVLVVVGLVCFIVFFPSNVNPYASTSKNPVLACSCEVDSCVLVYNDQGHGSGVIIGKNIVLTAGHVGRQPYLSVETNDGDIHIVIRTVIDPKADIALLFIEDMFDEPILSLSTKELKTGDEILEIGTPFDMTNFNCVLPGHVVKIDAKIDYNYLIPGTNMDIMDAHSGPGISGGPVILDGKVVGIVVASSGLLNASIPIGDCIDFINETR